MNVLELKERDAHTKNVVFFFSWAHLDSTRQNRLSNYTVGWIKVWLSFKKESNFPLTTTLLASTWESPSPTGAEQVQEGSSFLITQHGPLSPDQGRDTTSSQGQMCCSEHQWWDRMWSLWTISKHSVSAWPAEKNEHTHVAGWNHFLSTLGE